MPPGPQRTRIDWDAALAFYVSLGPQERSFQRVADEFPVSMTTVKKWAKRNEWHRVAAEADAVAGRVALDRAVRTRSERTEAVLKLVDEYLDQTTARIKTKDLNIKASDVPHLVKLAELLLGEPTDRIQISQLEPLLDAYDQALDRLRDMASDREGADRIIEGLDERLLALAAQARQRAEA
jgi:hypothetical protein